jgi:hypothetical protein
MLKPLEGKVNKGDDLNYEPVKLESFALQASEVIKNRELILQIPKLKKIPVLPNTNFIRSGSP